MRALVVLLDGVDEAAGLREVVEAKLRRPLVVEAMAAEALARLTGQAASATFGVANETALDDVRRRLDDTLAMLDAPDDDA